MLFKTACVIHKRVTADQVENTMKELEVVLNASLEDFF